MNITDELREWASVEVPYKYGHQLTAIADRIDAEYEEATSEFWQRINAVPATDENMAEHGWVRLPVDADGEVWNVGDFAVGEVNPNNPQEVERMLWYGLDSGWQIETDHIIFPCPEKAHHYHAPTVEDVLREMLYKAHIYDEREMELLPELIAEYAAKLQLRGEDA